MVVIFSDICCIYGQEVSINKGDKLIDPITFVKGKTEVLVVQSKNSAEIIPNVILNGKTLGVVPDFKYVGSKENKYADMDTEVNSRIQSMKVAFKKLSGRVFENRHINLKAKWSIYCSMVRVSETYGCGAWNTTQKHLNMLESRQYQTLLSCLGYVWSDKRSYIDIISELSSRGVLFKPLEAIIRRTRLTYAGHVERMSNSRHPKIVMHAELEVGTRSGGVQTAWRHSLKSDLKHFNINPDHWQILCQNRKNWRKLIDVGEAFFMNNWLNKKIQESVKRHENDFMLNGIIYKGRSNDFILDGIIYDAIVDIAGEIIDDISNGIIVINANQPEILMVAPTAKIVVVENFDMIENAMDDKGNVLTGRGFSGRGATVTVGRGKREGRKNQQGVTRRNISKASRCFDELKQARIHKQIDTNLYCVCQEQPLEDGKEEYIVCEACSQSYHTKCVNYNVINDHVIMEEDYFCGYCKPTRNNS